MDGVSNALRGQGVVWLLQSALCMLMSLRGVYGAGSRPEGNAVQDFAAACHRGFGRPVLVFTRGPGLEEPRREECAESVNGTPADGWRGGGKVP